MVGANYPGGFYPGGYAEQLITRGLGASAFECTEPAGAGTNSTEATGNGGSVFFPRVRADKNRREELVKRLMPDEVFQHIAGTGYAVFQVPDAQGSGRVENPKRHTGRGASGFGMAQVVASGRYTPPAVRGAGSTTFHAASSQGTGTYDRSHFNQLEAEDEEMLLEVA